MAIKLTTLVLCFFFILPLLASYCSLQLQGNCGINGTECQYYRWFNGTCVQPSNCPIGTTFLNSTYNCEACGSLGSSNCASCSQYGYYYASSLSLCTQCSSIYGYFCTSCNSSQCLSCNGSLGDTLATDKQSCVDPRCGISFCVSCSNITSCGQCDDLHLLYSGICICKVANCMTCTKGTSICQQCLTGYQVTASRTGCAPICMVNCLSCNSPTTCTTCAYGYYYSSSNLGNSCKINCTLNAVAFCLSCTSLNYCSQCKAGYSINNYGSVCSVTCTDHNCQVCSTNASVCTICNTGYKVASNGSCQQDICTITNCVQCNGFATCSACATYYILANSNTACNPNCSTSNCAQCANLTFCKTCDAGYGLDSSGFCNPLCSISNCAICLSASTCQSCLAGYILSSDQTACNFNCQMAGCLVCASISTCGTCSSAYTLSNGSCNINCAQGYYQTTVSLAPACAKCPAHCLSCSQVSSLIICSQCTDLYYLDSITQSCLPCTSIDSHCYTCQTNAATCTACSTGYILQANNTCQTPPLTCSVGNCTTCGSSGSICLTCNDGYDLGTNGTCSQPLCPSGQFLQGSTCTCGDGAYYYGSKCLACSSNCIICSAISCTSCTTGFYPSGTTCVPCSSNCLSCTTGSVCNTCASGYSVISSACQSASSPVSSVNGQLTICPAGCSICSQDASGNIICTQALDHYVVVQGAIYICDTNCFTCRNVLNSNTNTFSYCLSCYNGQGLSSGTCVSCTDANARTCSTSNAAYSITCATGYIPVNGLCTACAVNCLKCNNNGAAQCDAGSCATGFTQVAGSTFCVACFAGCTNCDSSNPNICLACGNYKFLNNGSCQGCPSNCIACASATACKNCVAGYSVFTDGSCQVPPGPPCVAYDSSLTCTQCDSRFRLSSGTCVFNTDCNATGICTTCAYNYYLLTTANSTVGNCLHCPYISNCQSCNVANSGQCLACSNGYYVNSAYSCSQCVTGCATCTSPYYCSLAKDGYYLGTNSLGSNNGVVNTCHTSCATCASSNTFCLSCKTDYTLSGGHCTHNHHYRTKLVGSIPNYGGGAGNGELGNMFLFYPVFLNSLWMALQFQELEMMMIYLQMLSIGSGSITNDFTVDADQVSADPSTLLTSSNLGGFGIISSSSAVNGGGSSSSSSSSTSNVSLGLVLGVAIPLGVLLIAIIVIIKVKYSSSTEEEMFDPSQKEIEFNEQF